VLKGLFPISAGNIVCFPSKGVLLNLKEATNVVMRGNVGYMEITDGRSWPWIRIHLRWVKCVRISRIFLRVGIQYYKSMNKHTK
jgi:hypothetical protein